MPSEIYNLNLKNNASIYLTARLASVQDASGMLDEVHFHQILRQQVGALVLCIDLLHLNVAMNLMISYEMAIEFNILVATRNNWVVDHCDAGVVVLIDLCWMPLLPAEFTEDIAQPKDVLRCYGDGAILGFACR